MSTDQILHDAETLFERRLKTMTERASELCRLASEITSSPGEAEAYSDKIADALALLREAEAVLVDHLKAPLDDRGEQTQDRAIAGGASDPSGGATDLAESRRRLVEAQQVAHIGSWEWDINTNKVTWSDELYRIFGLKPQETQLSYGAFLDYLHLEDRGFVRQLLANAFYDHKPFSYEGRIIHADQTVRVIHLRGQVILSEGVPARMVGIAQDITARKQAESEMSRMLSVLSTTLESTTDGILVVDNNGRIESHNKKFLEMWQIPEEVIESNDDKQVLDYAVSQVKDPEPFLVRIKELYARPEAESFDVIELKDGKIFERYSQPQRIAGHSIGRVWSFRDVTGRNLAERERARLFALEQAARHEAEHISRLRNELLEREEKARREWQATFDAMSDAVMLIDRNDNLIRANRAFYELFNIAPEFAVGRAIKEIVHPKNSKYPVAETCPVCELRARGERGVLEMAPGIVGNHPVFASTAPITDQDGNIIAMVQVIRDLTDLYSAREAAERERVSLNATIEQMAEGFVVFDESASIVRVNKQALHILGFSLDQLTARGSNILAEGRFSNEEGQTIAVDDLPVPIAMRNQTVIDTALWYVRPDGQKLLLSVTASPFFDDESRLLGAMALIRDVTERKRERERLQQAEKLRALGQLSSGVAHNFNNALAAVIGYAQLALPKVQNSDLEKYLRVIEQSAKDAARMVERIQNFARSRSRKDQFIQVRVSDVVRDAIDITRPRWRNDAQALGIIYDVTLQWQAEEDALVTGEPSELREVFVNIILNALDAMPGGGRLTITGSVTDSSIAVSLSDTGLGMTEEVRRRVFEPFFTTKGTSGLGMGLSESYRIIERHNGRIDIESQVRQGTTFTILLPLARLEESISRASDEDEPAIRASVLVIDDEEFVRNVLAAILIEQGHKVVKAGSAAEGIQLFERHKFDIVFTDLAMPESDGIAAANEIKSRAPETKVVLMSGYGSDKANARAGGENSIDAVISKPFRLTEIRETIKTLLE